MSRRMAFLHLPPIRWLTSFYNPPLNVVELFPHPDLVKSLSRTKLKNRLINSTDKNLSNMKGYKYADQLLKLAQDAYPAAGQNSVQVDEVRSTKVITAP